MKIPQQDQERIDAMVSAYRHSLEHLYELAHIQGQIDSAQNVVPLLRTRPKAQDDRTAIDLSNLEQQQRQ